PDAVAPSLPDALPIFVVEPGGAAERAVLFQPEDMPDQRGGRASLAIGAELHAVVEPRAVLEAVVSREAAEAEQIGVVELDDLARSEEHTSELQSRENL